MENNDERESVMKKIAVACQEKKVAQHFGHCEGFWIFTVEDDHFRSEELISNPGHKPGFLPNFLADRGVDVIISGGMGRGAVEIFEGRGIKVVVGASGDCRESVEAYLKGELVSTGAVCQEHSHSDECGD